MKPKIIIVDYHQLFNEGIKNLLQEKYEVVCQLFKGSELINHIQKHSPELVLMDINMLDTNGLELAGSIKKNFPRIKVVILSIYKDVSLVLKIKNIGLDGYIHKSASFAELKSGLEIILEGKPYYRLAQSEPAKDESDEIIIPQVNSLTIRELEIVRFFKKGLHPPQIANELFISEETVKTHRKHIYFKLGISSVSELISFAFENNI